MASFTSTPSQWGKRSGSKCNWFPFLQKNRGLCFTNLFANYFANSGKQFANCSRTGVREFSENNPVVPNNFPLVRELIREQFANKPSLLCLGIFTKLAYFGGSFEMYQVLLRIFREKSGKVRSVRLIS